MNKYVKGAFIFTGGVTVGTGIGAGLVVVKVITNDKLRKALAESMGDKLCKFIYGEEPAPVRKRSYKSYYKPYTDADEVFFDTQEQAEKVLKHLKEVISTYSVATVADFYDLAGVGSAFNDTKRGWADLSDAHVDKKDSYYVITLPKACPID